MVHQNTSQLFYRIWINLNVTTTKKREREIKDKELRGNTLFFQHVNIV